MGGRAARSPQVVDAALVLRVAEEVLVPHEDRITVRDPKKEFSLLCAKWV